MAFPQALIRGFADCAGQPIELDPDTGQTYAADARQATDGRWEICTSFPALGSRLFVIPKKETTQSFIGRPRFADVRTTELSGTSWDISLSECNNPPLDRPCYRAGDGDWQGPGEILRVDRAVRAAMSLAPRGAPWCNPGHASTP